MDIFQKHFQKIVRLIENRLFLGEILPAVLIENF